MDLPKAPRVRLQAIYPNKTGLSLVFLGFFLYLVSMQAQSGLLFLIIGILAACYVMNLIEAGRSALRLEIEPPAKILCTEGESAREAWGIRNPSNQSLGLAEVRSPWGTIFRVGAVPPHETAQVTPVLRMARRGVFPFSTLHLLSSFPFGLVEAFRQLNVAGEIVVQPKPYACAAPVAAGFEPMVGGRYQGRNRVASGDNFHGVRPLVNGDPLRLIHWKSSCKGLGLMVKEFEEELSGRISLVVEPGAGRSPEGELLLDWSCRCAASLLLASLDEGHQIEFTTPGAAAETLSVPPFADGDVVLEALARQLPRREPVTRQEWADTVARLPRKSALCFVLVGTDETFRAFAEQELLPANRTVSVYLPETERDADPIPGVSTHYYGAREVLQEV